MKELNEKIEIKIINLMNKQEEISYIHIYNKNNKNKHDIDIHASDFIPVVGLLRRRKE